MHTDLLILGAGSGNSLPEPGRSTVLVTTGPFGGTCLNVGCIPTKMFAYTAEVARMAEDAERFGVSASLKGARWAQIRDRIFGRIDPISEAGKEYRLHHEDNADLTLIEGVARFVGPKTIEVGGQIVSADQVVIATGSRPSIPPIEGLTDVPFYTSDTIMRLDELPASMMILGSGFIAAEFASIFSALGVDVTIIARSDKLLRREDEEISTIFTEVLSEKVTVVTNFDASRACADDVVTLSDGGRSVSAEVLLVATGRTPNADTLNCEAAGIDVVDGRVAVDEYQRVLGGGSVLDGVWAAGDVSSPYQLKHVANAEMRSVASGIAGTLVATNHDAVPHAVFADPQIAAVGLTEAEAADRGSIRVGRQRYCDIAYGWAMEVREDYLAKVIVDDETDQILGAHIIGPDAATIIQPLITACAMGLSASDMARGQYWIHPAMPELIENALLNASQD